MASQSTTDVAIEVRGLEKRYGAERALSGIDFAVPRGSCFTLLGPNGAGKTTTVHILATLVGASGGEARVDGHDVAREAGAVRSRVGIVFQDSCLDPRLSAREHLDLSARIYRVADRRERVVTLLGEFGIAEVADRPTRTLSGGQQRRLEIARAVLHRPSLLFLDEPTAGLDVAARAAVWGRLRAMRDNAATTLFLTTHSMEEADALSDQVGILERGRLVICGSPEQLKAGLGGDRVFFRVEREGGAQEALAEQPGVRGVVNDGRGFCVRVDAAPRRLAALVRAAEPFGIAEVEFQRPSLEDVYLHHTGTAYPVEEEAAQGEGDADAGAGTGGVLRP
jgi:ABC-2 type transport system ATP-binding protein